MASAFTPQYTSTNEPRSLAAPPRPPAAPRPRSTVASAANPYASLIGNDPILRNSLAGINAQGVANQAGYQGNVQQRLAMFGGIPDNLPASVAGFVTPTVRGLADAATQGGVSTLAGLARQAHGAQAYSNESLAARGMLRSGALGQHANENIQNAEQARFGATQQLLGDLGTANQDYLDRQGALQGQAATAAGDANSRYIEAVKAGVAPVPGGTVAGAASKPAAAPVRRGSYTTWGGRRLY